MKTALLVGLMAASGIALAQQSQMIMGPDGRNIGSATQYGNYTQFTDKNGNTGYAYSDGQNTTFTDRNGRPAAPAQVIPQPDPYQYQPQQQQQKGRYSY